MKRVLSCLLFAIFIFSFAACSTSETISSDEYNKLKNEKEELQGKYSSLETEYNKYKEQTKDWNNLSEEEKTAKQTMAKHEDDIKALESQISEKQKDIEGKKAEVDSLQSEIDKLKNNKKDILSTVTLKLGNYTVGEDIEPGKYKVTATAGTGNLIGKVSSLTIGLNTILSSTGEMGYSKTYDNLKLSKGDTFEIMSNLIAKFERID